MSQQSKNSELVTPGSLMLLAMIIVAALTRLIPHPMNFSPVEAMALFAGAYFAHRGMAVLVPLLAMLISDIALATINGGMYAEYFASAGFVSIYACIAVISFGGMLLRGRVGVLSVALAGFSGALLFFLVSNGLMWLSAAKPYCDISLVSCYSAAIPFFKNQLAGVAVYSTILFGGFAFARRQISVLKTYTA